MIVYTTVHVPEHDEQREIRRACDICGAESGSGTNWSTDHWSYKHVAVEYRAGGDGEEFERESADVCPDCFVDRLIPWIKEQGEKRDH